MWVNGTAGISWGGPYNQAGELIIGMIIIIMHENVIDLGIFFASYSYCDVASYLL